MEDEIHAINLHYQQKLKTIRDWQRVLKDFEAGLCTEEVKKACPEIAEKIAENEKLAYRLGIMKRALNDVKSDGPSGSTEKTDAKQTSQPKSKKPSFPQAKKAVKPTTTESANNYIEVEEYGDSIMEKLDFIVSQTVKKLYPNVNLNCSIREATQNKFGDYQFDMATTISRQVAEQTGSKVTPLEVAQNIAKNIPSIPLIGKVEAVGLFVNIFLNETFISERIVRVFEQGMKIPKLKKRKVVVDFSSPNIAKQMHVGHLRSTIIGESICRLLELFGFEVLRLNHIGDWGTQFGMLIAHLQDRFPNYVNETPPIQDLQTFYKESKTRFDKDEDFKRRAYECVVKLQNFDENIVRAWNLICDVSRRDFNRIYERLDIRLEERGESFYQQRMIDLVDDLQKMGKLKEDDGRQIFFPAGYTIPLTIVKSDGGFTYDTSDLATLKQRIFEEGADWCLYVVDAGQSEHFETFFAAARELGWYDPAVSRIEHVQFGLVLGEDKKKFKTRSGDTVKLTDLLDEGIIRAEAKLLEKGRDKELTAEEFTKARDAVAYGCVKYVDLSHVRTSDYVFSYDKMLEDRGNTAVYLLYAYARFKAIARTAKVSREEIEAYVRKLGGAPLPLTDEREFKLAKQILKFSDCILGVIKSLQIKQLCDYIYNLANTFHNFYNECYIVHKKGDEVVIDYHRLVLCEVATDVMLQCFNLLGIRAVEKM